MRRYPVFLTVWIATIVILGSTGERQVSVIESSAHECHQSRDYVAEFALEAGEAVQTQRCVGYAVELLGYIPPPEPIP